jgi:hypothetical protein
MADSIQVIVLAKMLAGLLVFKGGIDLVKDAITLGRQRRRPADI